MQRGVDRRRATVSCAAGTALLLRGASILSDDDRVPLRPVDLIIRDGTIAELKRQTSVDAVFFCAGQIVGASLQAFSISIDQIVESALLHQGAYVRYGREGEKQTQTLIEQGTARLAELEREAARIQQNMEAQRAQLQGLTFAVSKQKARLQEILEFFGPEAVERVQQTSVKLRSQDERRGGKDL